MSENVHILSGVKGSKSYFKCDIFFSHKIYLKVMKLLACFNKIEKEVLFQQILDWVYNEMLVISHNFLYMRVIRLKQRVTNLISRPYTWNNIITSTSQNEGHLQSFFYKICYYISFFIWKQSYC